MPSIKFNSKLVFLFAFVIFVSLFYLNKSTTGSSLAEVKEVNESETEKPRDFEDEERNLVLRLRAQKWLLVEQMMKKEEKSRRLPSIIGIGVEKCGTHALGQFLWHHPLIRYRSPVEAHFFEGDREKNLTQYRESMPEAEENAYIFEKTPAYFSFPPIDLPQIMKSSVPNAKLLVVLCDPAMRVISDYAQELAMRSITKEKYPTVEDFLKPYILKYSKYSAYDGDLQMKSHRSRMFQFHRWDYPSTILTTGFYALHMSRWLESYDRSNMLIVNGGDLMENPGRVVERMQEFLELPKLLLESDYVRDPETGFFCLKHPMTGELSCLHSEKMRTRNGKTKVLHSTLEQLRRFYAPANEHLFEMIGERFDW